MSWWEVTGETCVAAYQPIGAASLAASYSNLANPGTYDAAPGTAPTLDADGWVFASSAYLKSGVIPGAAYTMIVRFSNYTPTGGAVIAGSEGATGTKFYFYPQRSTSEDFKQYAFGDDGTETGADTGVASGVMALAANKGYYNGSFDVNAGTWSGTGLEIYIAACNVNGTAMLFSPSKIQALAIYSTTLDATQIADLTDVMEALTGAPSNPSPSVTDAVTVGESVTVLIPFLLPSVTDAVTTTSTAATASRQPATPLSASVTDAVTTGEAQTVFEPFLRPTASTDAVTTSEVASALEPFLRPGESADAVTTGEAQTVFEPFLRPGESADAVTTGEAQTVFEPFLRPSGFYRCGDDRRGADAPRSSPSPSTPPASTRT